MPFTYQYPRPSVGVDCVVFGFGRSQAWRVGDTRIPGWPFELQVLLIERGEEPFKGYPALPGGFVHVSDEGDQGEDLEAAARRELREETNVAVDYLEQLCTIGTPGRDPRGRTITVAYYALVRSLDHVPEGGDDAKEASWHSLRAVLQNGNGLAFDHDKILRIAYERLRAKVRYAPVGFHLLSQKFTLAELQQLYEAILMRTLDRANFRRRLREMKAPILVPAGRQKNVPHRAATLYRFDKRAYDKAVRDGFHFEI